MASSGPRVFTYEYQVALANDVEQCTCVLTSRGTTWVTLRRNHTSMAGSRYGTACLPTQFSAALSIIRARPWADESSCGSKGQSHPIQVRIGKAPHFCDVNFNSWRSDGCVSGSVLFYARGGGVEMA